MRYFLSLLVTRDGRLRLALLLEKYGDLGDYQWLLPE